MLEDQMWFEPEEALAVAWRQGVDEGREIGADEADRGWIEPLKDKIHSGVDGMGTARISDLADRTQRVFESRVQKA